MKTNQNTKRIVFTLATMLLVGIGSISAQSTTDNLVTNQTVAVPSQDGTILKTPASLRVNVQPLNAAFPKFLLGLQNESKGYVTIRIKNARGRNIHRPIFCLGKSLVATFNMSGVEEGMYIVEVANKHEHYSHQIEIVSKVVRSVEVKPHVLARLK